eukprot:Pompholyxophrys_sp_v1_NODE_166_length_1404_cov_1.601927.p2 type:complete len:106 gc:universal NODE_166_length_1404_cov_1.601927:363-680(+)
MHHPISKRCCDQGMKQFSPNQVIVDSFQKISTGQKSLTSENFPQHHQHPEKTKGKFVHHDEKNFCRLGGGPAKTSLVFGALHGCPYSFRPKIVIDVVKAVKCSPP